MAEHNELGKLGEKWRSNFLGKTAILFKYQWTFQKQKLISLPKENTLAIVEGENPPPH
jgi:hypothetical protein